MLVMTGLLHCPIELRRSLKAAGETIPNQIRTPISNPTMRWVFQLFEGINWLEMTVGGTCVRQIDGMDALRNKVVKHLGKGVLRLYPFLLLTGRLADTTLASIANSFINR